MMYKTENEVLEVISLGKPIEVVDMFLESYLQGLEYAKWADGKDLEETKEVVVWNDDNTESTIVEELVNVYEPLDVSEAMAQWKTVNQLEKKYGAKYGDFMVPFRNEDAMALLQVKAAFELGLTSTNIEFSNGVRMSITVEEFPAFAAWFVEKRNGYFA